ncbi:MAG: murein L,D-transpeptidase YafK, partial [Candidatus Azotimanducaceae bacterium]
GAFPLNYPNAQDRLMKRTGSGIWLNGLPKGVQSRRRLDSDGCVVIDNETLECLKPLITNNETLAVLLPGIEWSAEQLLITIEEWRQSLASNR